MDPPWFLGEFVQVAAWEPVISAARSSGSQERRRRWWAPGEEAARAFQVLRRPQLVIDDAVHVRVVLGEVARRILEIPEEVRPREVAAETPDVPLRAPLEHGVRAAADIVDVVDLP